MEEEMTVSVWDYLEQNNDYAPEAQALYSWGLNCDRDGNPFLVFLDLIGWSQENYGELMHNGNKTGFGFIELGYLADALAEYVNDPQRVGEWVDGLMNCEGV